MPCTLPKANGYLRGCHGSWLITSVSSRRCRAAASRPLAHMLTQPPNGQSATFHISQIPAEGVSTSPPTLEPSRLASTIIIKKKNSVRRITAVNGVYSATAIGVWGVGVCEGGYWLWSTATVWMKYSNKERRTSQGGGRVPFLICCS